MLGVTNMSQGNAIRKWSRLLVQLAFFWLVVASFLTVQFWPVWPHSQLQLQWLLFVVFGPPVYVLGESFFSWFFSPAHGQAVSHRRFSTFRIFIALPVVLVLFTLSWWLSWLLTKP